MIIHGTEDDTFPVVHGYDLYAAAQEPKYFWEVEGLWHVNAAAVDPEGFKENVLPFLDKALR